MLEVKNITKVFPGVKALDEVSITFQRGKVHGVLGENGAGKSTLVKIINNIHEPEEGDLLWNDKSLLENEKLFEIVSYVPQEVNLFKNMSVAENIALPFDEIDFDDTLVQKRNLKKLAKPWIEKLNIEASPEQSVKDTSVTDKQMIQIGRALSHSDYEVIIFDEPTTSLDKQGKEKLFEIICDLKEEDVVIIYISHKLEELFEIGDEVTVLRDGKKVGHSNVSEVDKNWMVKKMSGKEIEEKQNYRPVFSQNEAPETVLEVKDLTGIGFADISFKLRAGEILGFAGIVGAGRTEIMQTIFGYLPAASGEIHLNGQEWKFGDTNFSVKHGLFYLPEDRKDYGILPNLPVKNNISTSILDQLTSAGLINLKKETSLVKDIVDSYEIKTASLQKKISNLSGGNQQKTILGRTMSCDPSIMIFDEPTKGIDIATKEEIYKLMQDLAENEKIGIIFVSSELEELMRCANRIITVNEGQITGEFDASKVRKAEVLAKITKNID